MVSKWGITYLMGCITHMNGMYNPHPRDVSGSNVDGGIGSI